MNEKDHNCLDFDQTREHIRKYGLSVIRLNASSYLPSFAYSVGLSETYQHPEIICFGLKPDLLHEIINDVAEIIRKEGKIKAKEEYTNIFRDSRAIFLEVDPRNMKDYFGLALSYYKEVPINGLQLVWTDRIHFPGKKALKKNSEICSRYWIEMQSSSLGKQRIWGYLPVGNGWKKMLPSYM